MKLRERLAARGSLRLSLKYSASESRRSLYRAAPIDDECSSRGARSGDCAKSRKAAASWGASLLSVLFVFLCFVIGWWEIRGMRGGADARSNVECELERRKLVYWMYERIDLRSSSYIKILVLKYFFSSLFLW